MYRIAIFERKRYMEKLSSMEYIFVYAKLYSSPMYVYWAVSPI